MILKRSDGYIGTLIDDLVTKGTNEPYRIMTSRSEYRLLHRQDNADERLSAIGHRIGLVSDAQYAAVQEKYRAVAQEIRRLESSGIPESAALNAMLTEKGTAAVKGSAVWPTWCGGRRSRMTIWLRLTQSARRCRRRCARPWKFR